MKQLSIIFCLISSQVFAQIDELQTEAQVESFIHSIRDLKHFELQKIADIKIDDRNGDETKTKLCKSISQSLGIDKSYYKADFDNNGTTDLFVIGKAHKMRIVIIMDMPQSDERFQIHRLYDFLKFSGCAYPKIVQYNNKKLIDLYFQPHLSRKEYRQKQSNPEQYAKTDKLNKVSLIYKFGNFIEYNPIVKDYAINKIEFQAGACYGTCPVFKISIDNYRSAEFIAQKYNSSRRNGIILVEQIKGIYQATLLNDNYPDIGGSFLCDSCFV